MKKVFAIFFTLVIGLCANANPVGLMPIEISELFFDDSGNWKLELRYYNYRLYGIPVDSIFLYSSSHTAQLPLYEFTDYEGEFVITADSLDAEFHISRFADVIKVISYSDEYPSEDILVFGDLPKAIIGFPKEGQSIGRYKYDYSKDKSPTIGFPNDTLGMCGTLKGVIYDMEMNPVKNIKCWLDFPFETNSKGEYSTRVLSAPRVFRGIDCGPEQSFWDVLSTEEVAYVMEPDSIIERDIYLLTPLSTDMQVLNIPISVYPNPIPRNGTLNVDIDLPVNTADIYVEIVDLTGRIVRKKKISHSESSIAAPNATGVYIMRTLLDSQPISSIKIVVHE